MWKWTGISIALLLVLGRPALAGSLDDPSPASGTAQADEDFQPSDALYAPEEMTSTTATGVSSVSYYSQAKLEACDLGHDSKPLEGAELFIDGQFVGKSPLKLNGFLVNNAKVALSARLPGYGEALRSAMLLPASGEARIYLVGDNAASWYTTPAFVAGLLAVTGSIVAYSQKGSSASRLGLGLAIGGAGIIAISQAVAHWIQLPMLQKKTFALNQRPEALP